MLDEPGAGDRPARELEREDVPAHEPLRCSSCRTEVGDPEAAVSPDGGPAERVFFNPAGHVMRVLLLGAARNLLGLGPRSDEFTWFAGMDWQIVVCSSCKTQLGWHFDAQAGVEARPFWALLVERLERR